MNSRLSRTTPKNNLAFTGEIALSTPNHATPLIPLAESHNLRRIVPPPSELIKPNEIKNIRRNFVEPDLASDKINKELNEIEQLLERKKNQRLGIVNKTIEVEPPTYILKTDNVKSTLSRTTNVTSTKNMVAPIQTDYLALKFNAKEEVKKPRNLNPQETAKSQPQFQSEKFSNLLTSKQTIKKDDISDKKPSLFNAPSNIRSQPIAKNNLLNLNSEIQKVSHDLKQINPEKSKISKPENQEPQKNQKIQNSKVSLELPSNGKVGGQINVNQKNSKLGGAAQEVSKITKEISKTEKIKNVKEEPEEVVVKTEVGEMKLILCREGCGRRFNENALQKHEKVCKKVFQEKREVFDSAGTRISEVKDENEKKEENESTTEEKKKSWEKKSEAFRNVIRATKNQFFQPGKEKKGKGKIK